MPAPILTTASTVICPHGGSVSLFTGNALATIQGAPALLLTDVHVVVGCPFTVPPGTPSPCVTVRWMVGAARTRVNGTPVLLQTSVGLCFNALQVPQGPPIVVNVQPGAMGV